MSVTSDSSAATVISFYVQIVPQDRPVPSIARCPACPADHLQYADQGPGMARDMVLYRGQIGELPQEG